MRDDTRHGTGDEQPEEDFDSVGVELVRWPEQTARRDRFARDGIPRLLLVAPGVEPPVAVGLDEDWVRLPVDERDLRARIRELARTAALIDDARPWLDEHGQLHRGPSSVRLTPAEAIVARLLLASPGTVVDRQELQRRIWPRSAAPGDKAVDAIVYRLRRRVGVMHLHIRTVRSRGFVLDL